MKKELILYIIFGAATTAVNIIVYSVCYNVLAVENIPSNVIAWVLSVGFACATNRKWVFKSRTKGLAAAAETAGFFGGRIFTGLIDLVLMYAFVDRMGFDGDITKVIVNVLVIVLNYVISKLWVFRKKENI